MTSRLHRQKTCPSDHPRAVDLAAGDAVRYIGAELRIKADYGGPLTLVAVDMIHGRAICINHEGRCLVGVAVSDLQKIRL